MTRKEYKNSLRRIQELMDRTNNLSQEEEIELDKLVDLVQDFEEENYEF